MTAPDGPERVLVTGGQGFIGSAVVRFLIGETGAHVLNLDALTYAASPEATAAVAAHPRYRFVKADIRDRAALDRAFTDFLPDAVLHLAAESHVDRSIDGPGLFVDTNVRGTTTLLDAIRAYLGQAGAPLADRFRLLHVSTDEVYGSLGPEDPPFTEHSPYRPNSPYAASKAASDHLVRAYHHTYGLPALVSNCSNNYGPFQFPEKLIPVMILNGLAGRPLPVYGQGTNVRDWLHVEDHARALWTILTRGRVGATYLVGGANELTNIDLVGRICDALDRLVPTGAPRRGLIRFVDDRPGHDLRYAVDAALLARELGWRPRHDARSGLEATIRWYLDNRAWLAARAGVQGVGERLGLGR